MKKLFIILFILCSLKGFSQTAVPFSSLTNYTGNLDSVRYVGLLKSGNVWTNRTFFGIDLVKPYFKLSDTSAAFSALRSYVQNNFSLLGHSHSIGNITGLQSALNGKLDSSVISGYYTKTQADSKFLQSVTEADPIATAALSNYYTKTQADGQFLKSFSELDPIATAALVNYYTKTQADAKFLQSYTEKDSLAIAALNNYYNKTQADARFLQNFTEADPVATAALAGKQNTLVSGTNIKTINGNSLLGSGDLTISGGGSVSAPTSQILYGTNTSYGSSANLKYDGSYLTVVGNSDGQAVGPLVVQAGTSNYIGTGLTLDATAVGGHKYSFFSSGGTAGIGPGGFAVYDGTADKYVMAINSSSHMLLGTNTDNGSYILQANGSVLAQGADLSGTTGNGYIGFPAQSSNPSTPSSGFKLFANSNGAFGWINSSGVTREFRVKTQTANNTYYLPDSSGHTLATIQGGLGRMVLSDNVQHSNTGSTTENTVYTGTIKGGSLGANGSAEIRLLVTWPANANNKTFKVKVNGTTIMNVTATSSSAGNWMIRFNNRNSTSSQVYVTSTGAGNAQIGWGTANLSPAVTTATWDTTQDMSLTVTITNAVSTDAPTLESIQVLTFYKD